MKKKKSSQNLHDVKKTLEVATGDYDDFTWTWGQYLDGWPLSRVLAGV